MADEILSTDSNKEATEDVLTIQEVSQNLSELLTNSVNIVDKYYELFFDPNPHYVELEQYNSDGYIFKTLVPNRAMDRTMALSGDKSPESSVEAPLGTLFIDTNTRSLYIKKTLDGSIGWENITPQRLEYRVETFNVDSSTDKIYLEKVNDGENRASIISKDNIDIYVNGKHLEEADFTLDYDNRTLLFNTQFPDYSTMQVKYICGDLYGIKGETALTVKVGEVHTVNSDTPAKVENVGTNQDLVLDFTIPKGATGDSGVWVGEEPPIENEEYLEDKNIWIDTSAEGYSDSDLAVTRIFDSGNNTNPIAYKKAFELMHNSIDSAKYAIIGDVNVSDKGILTAYGNGSGIRTTVKVKQLLDQEWSISGRDYLDISKGDFQYLFNIGGQTTNSTVFYFRSKEGTYTVNKNYIVTLPAKSFCFIDKQNDNPTFILEENECIYDVYGAGWYNWKVEYRKGMYYIYMSYNDFPLALRHVVECAPINQDAEEYVYISADSVNNSSHMLSDLTKFNIRVDNNIIWTPNRTGYDYVIEDNFKTIGTPVINNDGVLTHITDGVHFIYGDYKAKELLNKSWSIEGHFKYNGVSQVLWQFADPNNILALPIEDDMFAGDYQMLSVDINADDNLVNFNLRTGLVEQMSSAQTKSFNIELNKEYLYKFEYNEATFTYTYTLQCGDNVQTETYEALTPERNPLVCSSHPDYVIVIGSGSSLNIDYSEVYNDLNCFKIFNRGRLVYRPLFRIPCTISKDGSKFVDSSLRYMVKEAHELHNKGHLFVIDEINESVTLPLSDIYSLIQREYETRPTYGKGLKYDSKTNMLENLTQGSEIGDVGESVFVDETSGLRRVLNGQTINVTKDTEEFARYVLKLKDKGLLVDNDTWEAEVQTNGTCNKFVADVEVKTETVSYTAYIPDTFVIRIPIIDDSDDTPDTEETVEDVYCYNCGTLLQPGQTICTVCNADNSIKESDIVKDPDSVEQEDKEYTGPEVGDISDIDPDKIIGYNIYISSELTEADIVYATSLNPLDLGVVFRKIDGIIYPERTVSVEEILNEDLYYRYEQADFEVTEEVESANYIRLPKLNATKAGYECYIQVATGVKNTVDVENTYTHISPYSYGMYQYSDIELNNPGWLLSEGQWNNGAMYLSFYRWILKNANDKKDKFKKWNNPNYSVTRYDYVINEADGTFRLPLVASVSDFAQQRFLIDKKEATDADPTWYNIYSDGWCEQGGQEVILSGSAAALNYTNKTVVLPVPILHAINWNVQPRHDCFQGNMGAMTYMGSYESVTMGQKNFVAGTAYTNPWVVWSLEGYVSETTLAEHFKLANLYFYVGDTVQTNNHIDTGKMMEDLAKLRAELDYARKKVDNQLSVPSGTYQEIPCPASGGTYTAPADGWVTFRRTTTAANQWLSLTDNATGLAQLQWIPNNTSYAIVTIPVRKGAVVAVGYSAGTHNYLRFIPARGVVV